MNDIRTNAEDIMRLAIESINTKNLAASTMKNYSYHLNRILASMSEGASKKEFHPTARAYLVEMERRRLSNSSLIQARAAIKIGIEAIADEENGYKNWKPPRRKARKKIQKLISSEEVAALLHAARTPFERAILATALTTGLRRSEILNLKLTDFNRGKMEIHIREGKGCKDRIIPFPAELRETLVLYYHAWLPKTYMFCNPTTKEKLTPSQLEHTWKILKERAGVVEVKGLHSLRHYFATKLLEAGVNIVTLQQLLGHSHIQTTMIYLHMTSQMSQGARKVMGSLLEKSAY
jgi:site-specific recombinase XerD